MNIPTVSDYAHYNEEAAAVWYAENRYDMEHAEQNMDWEDGFERPDDLDEENE